MKRAAPAVFLLAAAILGLWRLGLLFGPTDSPGISGTREVHRSEAVANAVAAAATANQASVAVAPLPRLIRSQGAPAEVASLMYAQAWTGPQPLELAAFRAWTETYERATTLAERAALEPQGLMFARARKVAMRSLMERDPEAALAMTVPAAIRAQLPTAIAAELESRFSSRADLTVLAFDYDAAELARRRALGLRTDPFQYTLAFEGREYPAFVYGRRSGQTTKHGIPVHGLSLDGIVAVHAGALRVLEPGEPGATAGVFTAEMAGRMLEFSSVVELLRDEARLEKAEAGLGPTPMPVAANLTGIGSSEPSAPEFSIAAAPATSWTVGAKAVLVIRVDFSDLSGDPRRGSTIYSASYVQGIADSQIKPYYAQSSFGQTSITTTVSAQVYRMPRTATYYAVNAANTQLHIDARAAAAANFAVTTFDRVIVLFSSLGGISGSQITYGGLGEVGGKNVWVNGAFDFRVVAHELGHTYGLRHANLWQVSDGSAVSAAGASTEYGDDYDTMGANFANDRRTDFNPWFKNLLGWAADNQIQTITSSGTFRLNRIDNATGTGTLGLKFGRDATRNYWIGVRRNFTTNASMTHGAYVMWGYNSNQTSNLLDTTTPGSSVSDAALALGSTLLDTAGNVSIRAVSEGGVSPNEFLDVQVSMGLNGIPIFSAHPQDTGFNVGETVALGASVTGTAPLVYQWRKNGLDLPGATGATLSIVNAQAGDAGSYSLQVGNEIGAVASNAAAVGVNVAPSIGREPAHVTTSVGRTVTLSVGVNAVPAPTFVWRRNGTNVPGGTNATLSFLPVQSGDAGDYDVIVTNALGSTTSGVAKLVVNAATTPPGNDNYSAAWILPGDAGVAAGSNLGATDEAGEPSHVNASGTATSVWFRWTPTVSGMAQIDTQGSAFDTVLAVYAGTAVNALTKLGEDDEGGGLHTSRLVVPVTAGTTYSIAVGDFSSSRNGGEIVLHYGAFVAPQFTTQPQDQVSSIGGAASFTVAATGTDVAYQWYHDGVAVPGATGAALNLSKLGSADAGNYYARISNVAGSVNSSPALLHGTNAAPIITTPPVSLAVTSGQSGSLTVAASGSGTLNYQWRRNGVPIAGATGVALTFDNLKRTDADYYDVKVTAGLSATVSPTVRIAVAPTIYPTLVAPDSNWELRPESSGGTGNAIVPLGDGRAYIAGSFVSLDGVRRAGIARITAEGTLDSTFNPPEIDNVVRAVAVQSDGKLVLGGDFVRVNGLLCARLVRLNGDGSVDPTFDVGFGADASVLAVAIQGDGRIVVGGSFVSFAGSSRNFLVRLLANGDVDTGFLNRGMTSTVNALAIQTDGKIIVGGTFGSSGTGGYVDGSGVATARSRLARINSDGTLDPAYNPAPNNSVLAAVLQPDGRLVLGGSFTMIDGATVGQIARLGTNGLVDAGFNTAAGTGFSPSASVNALGLQSDGRILVGGTFTSFNGATVNRLVRLYTTGARDTGFLTAGFSSTVNAVGISSTDKICVGGGFANYLNAASFSTPRSRFARLNSDGTIDGGYNFSVSAAGTVGVILPVTGGKKVIAGFFTRLRGATVPAGVARINADGTVDPAFNTGGAGANSSVLAAALQTDGRILLTGAFTTYNGTAANGLVRLNADGTLDSSFNAGLGLGGSSGAGYTLSVLSGGRVFVGGSFTSVNGLPRSRVAVLNPDGSPDTAFDPGAGADSTIYASTVQADGKILIGGAFTAYNGNPAPRLARLSPFGIADTSFVVGSGPSSSVYTVAVQGDGKIIIGGTFSSYDGTTRTGVARLTGAGSLDATFVPPDVNNVQSLLIQEDGRVVIRGSFQSVDNAAGTAFLARLNQNGSRDTTFAAGGFTSSSLLPSVLTMGDGGGLFMQSNGAAGLSATEAAALPTITAQPTAQSVTAGNSIRLSVVAGSSLPARYQWYRNGTPVAGGNDSTLFIINAQVANAGVYTVVVSNELGSITSAPANLTVNAGAGGAQNQNVLILSLSGDPAPDGIGTLGSTSIFALAEGAAALSGVTVNGSGNPTGGIVFTATRLGVRTVMRAGNSAPGGGNFSGGSGQISVNSSGQVAFIGALTNTSAGFNEDEGVFVGTDAGVIQIVREGQSEPGGGPGIFNSFTPPSINSNGQVAFWGAVRNAGTPLVDTHGIFVGSGGALTRIARTYTPAPGGATQFGSVSSSPVISDTGQVAFLADLKDNAGAWGAGSGIFRGDGSNLVVIARKLQAVPEGGGTLDDINFPWINRNDTVAFYSTLANTPGGTTDKYAIYTGKGGALTKIVRTGDNAPDGNGKFDELNNTLSVNSQGDVAFTASLRNATAGRSKGVYWGNGAETRTIARSGDPTPDGASTYTNFILAAVNDTRTVTFQADLSLGANSRGIYLSDGLETMQVARVGDVLAGSTIVSLGFDPKAYNQLQQLAFQAILSNGQWGVFLFSPKLKWRLSGDGEWEDGNRWTVSLRPGGYAQVEIDPAAGGKVTGPVNPATIRTLKVGGTTAGTAELNLQPNGRLTVLEGANVSAKGKLTGNGSIAGNLINSGMVAPGNSAGVLTIDGNYTQAGGGSLVLQLGGPDPAEYDQILATGSVQLAGTITIELIDGFFPATATFDIIRGQTVQLNSPQFVVPSGYTSTPSVVSGPEGQTLRLTLVSDNAAAPTISDISDQAVSEDVATGALTFVVGDSQTPATSLTVTGTSSNQALVLNSGISFGGSGANRTVSVTPAANQSGSATITLTVSDGQRTCSDSFALTVNAVNDTPTIGNVPNQSINSGGSTGALAFTVGDMETAAAALVVTGTSSNLTLIPDANIVLGGTGTNRTVTVTPAAGQGGAVTITITASDGALTASTVFVVTVNAPPTISAVANQIIDEDMATAALAFTVGDAETAAGNLAIVASSSNPTLVPTGGITIGGSGTNRTVTVRPAANAFGSVTINLTVSDGQLTSSGAFDVGVSPVNDAPTMSNIGTQIVTQSSATGAIAFVIGDIETPAESLSVTGSSSNQGLVPDANIVFGGSGASRTVTVTPIADQTGSATITVAVNDGALSASDTFVVSVQPVGLSATHAAVGGVGYIAGSSITITNTLTYPGAATALDWQVLIPTGWAYVSGSGEDEAKPAPGTAGLLEWNWTTVPASPLTFTYTLQVPGTETGDRELAALVTFHQAATQNQILATPDPLVISQVTRHTADTNANDKIDVSELSRVITLYNARFTTVDGKIRTGAYTVATTTADGFAPDAARDPNTTVALARYHSADTNRNGRVDVSELSRVITLYNTRFTTPDGKIRTGFYKLAPGTLPDGFAPDPTRAP